MTCMAAHAFHMIVLASHIHATACQLTHVPYTHRQLTCSHTISVHTCNSCCANANRIAFSTLKFLSALKFISVSTIFECFLVSPFPCVFFFLLPLLLFTSHVSLFRTSAFSLSKHAVSSLERSSPLPEGRSRSLRSNRPFGGSSVTVVKMTPLSFLPGTRIIKYLGIINMFFIRETTSLREVRLQGRATHA